MRTKTTLTPGQKGTKHLYEMYGDQLVCVRYRYDKTRGKRFKTIELIVDEQEWMPRVTLLADRRMAIKIGYGEADLLEQVKSEGGYWNPGRKAWMLSYRKVLQMGLERRMVDEVLGF